MQRSKRKSCRTELETAVKMGLPVLFMSNESSYDAAFFLSHLGVENGSRTPSLGMNLMNECNEGGQQGCGLN